MKPSTSTNSLTALDEKGCIFCAEAEGELGDMLVDSKVLTHCRCVFRAHPSCWEERVIKSDEKLCPSCNKVVTPAFMLYPAISIERGYGGDDMSYSNWHMLYICLLLMVIIVIVILGFQLKWFKKES
jgi:hypothetical protein